jgi:hypothetical protein
MHDDQTGFLFGRRISENIVYAAERSCHLRKAPMFVFKIDFRKAFDSVNWDSLLTILCDQGFDARWCDWMARILDMGHTSIILHGILGDYIHCRNGLRQATRSPLASPSLLPMFSSI